MRNFVFLIEFLKFVNSFLLEGFEWLICFFRLVNEVICYGIFDMRFLEDGDIMNGRYILESI